MKTRELTDKALNWAVAKAEGLLDKTIMIGTQTCKAVVMDPYGPVDMRSGTYYHPCSNWVCGGLIIEQEGIGVIFRGGSAVREPSWFATPDDQDISTGYEGENFDPTFMVSEEPGCYGSTPLIAAMRCYVRSKLGDEIELPEGL